MEPLQSTNSREPVVGRRRKRLVVICACAAVLIGVSAVVLLRDQTKAPAAPADGVVDVPLGVEEAVIIRFAGPTLVARPYRRGASVSLRIARQVAQEDVRVYDVRYVVNLPGEFDLTDYLTSTDGSSIASLPACVSCSWSHSTDQRHGDAHP